MQCMDCLLPLWVRFANCALNDDQELYRSRVLHRSWVNVAISRLHPLQLHSSTPGRRLGVVSFQAHAHEGTTWH